MQGQLLTALLTAGASLSAGANRPSDAVQVGILARRTAGVIEKSDPDEVEMVLIKDQTREWHPTSRWQAFQMEIAAEATFAQSRQIN